MQGWSRPPEPGDVALYGRHGNIFWMRLPLSRDEVTGPSVASRVLTRGPYYGWVLVAALGLTEAISWGVLYYAFSVFLQPMEADLGWSRGATTGAFSLALVLSGFAAIPVGRWLDRHGARLLMSVGSCLARCWCWPGPGRTACWSSTWSGPPSAW